MEQTPGKDKSAFTLKMSPFLRNILLGIILGLSGFLATFAVQTFKVIYQNQTQIQFLMEQMKRDNQSNDEKFNATLKEISNLRQDLQASLQKIEDLQQQQFNREKAIGIFYEKYAPALDWANQQSKK